MIDTRNDLSVLKLLDLLLRSPAHRKWPLAGMVRCLWPPLILGQYIAHEEDALRPAPEERFADAGALWPGRRGIHLLVGQTVRAEAHLRVA